MQEAGTTRTRTPRRKNSPTAEMETTRMKKTGSRRRTHVATVFEGRLHPNALGPTINRRALQRLTLYRQRRDGIITQECLTPTSPTQATGHRKVPFPMQGLLEHSGAAPRPEITDSYQEPRRRLESVFAQLILSGQESETLSSAGGQTP